MKYVQRLNQTIVQEAKRTYYSDSNPGSLSLRDLLIFILGPMITDRSVTELTDQLIEQGLNNVSGMSEFELSVLLGLNESQSFHLMSVFELAKRMGFIRNSSEETIIRTPSDASKLTMDMQNLEKEHFVVLYLDTKNKVIGKETISIGSLDSAIVHPREVYKQAIRRGARSIVGVHNHPSGDPTPSPEDIALTGRLIEAGKIVGIDFLDHIIIGRGSYRSLKEQGLC